MIKKFVLLLPLLMAGWQADARTDQVTEMEIQSAFKQAYMARRSGANRQAEVIFTRIVELRPNAPFPRFELGVAQAQQGRCAAAARTFEVGKKLHPLPSFQRAVEAAMEDLCPGLAPFEASAGFELIYDTNANSGSSDKDVMVNGVPVSLSDEAVAGASFGYRATGRLGYNLKLSHTSYLVPSVGVTLEDYEGSDLDLLTFSPSVSYRYKGDRIDLRVGPTGLLSYDQDGSAVTGMGLSMSGSYSISKVAGLRFGGSFMDADDKRNAFRDYKQRTFGATYLRSLERGRTLSISVSWNDMDYEDSLQNLEQVQVRAGLRGSLTTQIGYDLGISYAINRGDDVHPFFGVVRKDNVATVDANLSFAKFDTFFGRPYLGVTHTISKSNFATKEFDRTRVNFGFTQSF